MNLKADDTKIESLGECKFESPLNLDHYTSDQDIEICDTNLVNVLARINSGEELPGFQVSGPREKLFFQPGVTRAGIVTCGGLCPGLNDVIRSLVMCLFYNYGIKEIVGFRFGYQGISHESEQKPVPLTPKDVGDIHNEGGTVLGSSRGDPGVEKMVDYIDDNNIHLLFTIGGDGTLKGACAIAAEIKKRGLSYSVVGVPKTIDNDISYVSRSFGFASASEEARKSIQVAHNEAEGNPHGIGIVKLMGRDSGFIAANAALANNEANYCLIPEVDFDLEGNRGLLHQLKKRIINKGHAVIVVAEGAGQKFFTNQKQKKDDSGNVLHHDIGLYLKTKINEYFSEHDIKVNIKYIDPSYMIRSVPANAEDSSFCITLGQGAVHAAMAGKTSMIVGSWNNRLVHIPMKLVTSKRKRINPKGPFWQYVKFATGQPSLKN